MQLIRNWFFALLVPCAAAVAGAAPSVESVIARARAFIGEESALEGVASLHFVGRLVIEEGSPGAKPREGMIDLVFQKPGQHRAVQSLGPWRETTALDGYEAWIRREEIANPSNWQIVFLQLPAVRSLQANCHANLFYYRGLEAVGGRAEFGGDATIDGHAAHRIVFTYPGGSRFVRCFDAKTGQLLLTETASGDQVREEGSVVVDGIRFPQKLVTRIAPRDGRSATVTITFESIRVNEKFAAELFVPPPRTAAP